jgi:hypothetical protein
VKSYATRFKLTIFVRERHKLSDPVTGRCRGEPPGKYAKPTDMLQRHPKKEAAQEKPASWLCQLLVVAAPASADKRACNIRPAIKERQYSNINCNKAI